jgi:E3 ubiquitin-protein ligase MYCBP2
MLTDGSAVIQSGSHALASDGQYLYLFAAGALYKLGSGYGGTIKGHLYLQRPDFSTFTSGWMGFANVRVIIFSFSNTFM